jgi:hypothetical protein
MEDMFKKIIIDHGIGRGLSITNPRHTSQQPRPAATSSSASSSSNSSAAQAPYEAKIPARVECQVPVLIKSKDNGKSKSLYNLKDVKEGDLIFKIKNPLLCIVS